MFPSIHSERDAASSTSRRVGKISKEFKSTLCSTTKPAREVRRGHSKPSPEEFWSRFAL